MPPGPAAATTFVTDDKDQPSAQHPLRRFVKKLFTKIIKKGRLQQQSQGEPIPCAAPAVITVELSALAAESCPPLSPRPTTIKSAPQMPRPLGGFGPSSADEYEDILADEPRFKKPRTGPAPATSLAPAATLIPASLTSDTRG
ncbi:hypothetical protein BGX33_011272 [Mortierella sp. NVP41]|nr:hypothetical protein BGX33_011272 [Mortierella sp. NVP41]